MPPHLILIRHADRDTSAGRELDNGLSEKGWKQEKRLRKLLIEHCRQYESIEIFTSPSRRCRETVAKLAKKLDLPVVQDAALGEQRYDESDGNFYARVSSTSDRYLKMDVDAIIACSHGDWIPVCIEHYCGTAINVSKGAAVLLCIDKKKFRWEWLIE